MVEQIGCPKQQHYILTLSSPDRKGIVRAVANFLYDRDATIVDAAQHGDPVSKRFFLRTEFCNASDTPLSGLAELEQDFRAIAEEFAMDWQYHDASRKTKVLIAVSKYGHCLNDLLHRWNTGVLPVEIVGVVSNHEDMREMVEWHNLPYHHLPVSAETKTRQEKEILEIMENTGAELLALARYMQILSNEMCQQLTGKAINIHHSFLPGFKGAKPYHQAYERGVKIIGATAHYVTSDLDEGPIIEQCTERVDHLYSPEELVQIGRDTECMAFARAIKWHCEHRVILNGNRTVVFK